MPYKNPQKKREYMRDFMKDYRKTERQMIQAYKKQMGIPDRRKKKK